MCAGETADALPAAETARLFRGRLPISGDVVPADWLEPTVLSSHWFHCAIEIISFLGGNPKNFRPHGNHAEPVGYHTRQVVILGRVSGSAQAFSTGGRGVRGGNSRCAASGRNSEAVSRKAPNQRGRSAC